MDNFDELNNNELRDKLKAFGLGNIPVTDTTRKLLIKKLRTAASGNDKPSKRRETVNVVKAPSDDSESDADAKKAARAKAAASRRTTIAAVAGNAGFAHIKRSFYRTTFTFSYTYNWQFMLFELVPKAGNVTNGAADEKVMPKPTEVRPKSPSRRTMGKQFVHILPFERETN